MYLAALPHVYLSTSQGHGRSYLSPSPGSRLILISIRFVGIKFDNVILTRCFYTYGWFVLCWGRIITLNVLSTMAVIRFRMPFVRL